MSKLLNEFASLWSFSLRELRMWQTYRTNQLMWVVDIFVNAFLFFLVGQLIGGSAASLLGVYGTNYVSFILIGLAVNYVIATNLADPFYRVTRTYWDGTMDLYLLSPMSVFTPFLGLMGRSFTDDYPRIFIVAGFGELFFGARFDLTYWAPALLVSLLTFIAAFGIGTISASMFYLINLKQGEEPIQFLIQGLLAGLVAGAYYPVTVLPQPLQVVALFLPHTYAFDALRRLLDPGADLLTPNLLVHGWFGLSPVMSDVVALALFSVVLMPLGYFLYVHGVEKARRNGTLTRWQ
jgi:ABC-2 type transport system permease protein